VPEAPRVSAISTCKRFLREALEGRGVGGEARMFLLFALVGAVGFAIDALVLVFCLGLGASRVIGRIISLFVSMNFTFTVNRAFVFKQFRAAPLVKQWALYVASNALGALVNFGVFLALTAPGAPLMGRNVLAVACGSIAGLVFNFTASRLTAFRR
jgi:putative flippase GtrA